VNPPKAEPFIDLSRTYSLYVYYSDVLRDVNHPPVIGKRYHSSVHADTNTKPRCQKSRRGGARPRPLLRPDESGNYNVHYWDFGPGLILERFCFPLRVRGTKGVTPTDVVTPPNPLLSRFYRDRLSEGGSSGAPQDRALPRLRGRGLPPPIRLR